MENKIITPLISIIIPVYNTKKYLNRCLDSVLNQTYTNLEVIIVDDGSTDGSEIVCDKYAQKDKRVRVIHKNNEGQCVARNVALDCANGEYLAFVDSDDWITTEMYEVLYKNAIQYNCELSTCSNSDLKKEENIISVFQQPEIMKEYLKGCIGLNQSPCNKLFKKSLFDGIRFVKMRAYEDCATLPFVLCKVKRAVFQDKIMYFYEKRENSTMTQPFSKIKFQSVRAYNIVHDFYKEHYPEYCAMTMERLVGSIQYCVGSTLSLKLEKECQRELIATLEIVNKIPMKELKIKQKICMYLIKKHQTIYKVLYQFLK